MQSLLVLLEVQYTGWRLPTKRAGKVRKLIFGMNGLNCNMFQAEFAFRC